MFGNRSGGGSVVGYDFVSALGTGAGAVAPLERQFLEMSHG